MNNIEISSAGLLERWRDQEDFSVLQKLMQQDIQGIEETASLTNVYQDSVQRLLEQYGDHRYEYLESKISQQGLGSLSPAELEEYKRHIGS